jgi:hypothetical protein
MTKPTTILFSEAIGAFTFSVTSAVITYWYAENSQLSSSGVGAVSIGGSPRLYILFATVLFTWIGMLIGGIVGFNMVSGKSGRKLAGNLGLGSGFILFLILFLSFKLKQEISFIFVTSIAIMSLISSYTCGLMSYFLIRYASKINFTGFSHILMILASLVLPLTTFIVMPILYADTRNNLLKNLIESFGSSIIVIPPMLILWAIFLAVTGSTKVR